MQALQHQSVIFPINKKGTAVIYARELDSTEKCTQSNPFRGIGNILYSSVRVKLGNGNTYAHSVLEGKQDTLPLPSFKIIIVLLQLSDILVECVLQGK